MTDFLLELRSEEIPARMQDRAREDLARLFSAELDKAGLKAAELVTYATPRRLTLIARDLPEQTAAVSEELKGPPADAPDAAIDGFLRKAGLTRDALETRDVKGRATLFAVIDRPGRATAEVLAEAIPAIIRAFPWPKSMRWGDASLSTESQRWVRPLQGIVALFGEDVVDCEVAGIRSGAATVGHRFHHPGVITIGSAADYVEKLRACHVIVDQNERRATIAVGAKMAANMAGLTLIEDEGLLIENAGLTEWPVPLLGRFDEAFLDVPPEVIQLTARVNQKYFVCNDASGKLANAFVCTANIDAADGGDKIVEGNQKVLAARLSDARFFWTQDKNVEIRELSKRLGKIKYFEGLGTYEEKQHRVSFLFQELLEHVKEGSGIPQLPGLWQAADVCKVDLVTGTVGEFPELQGVVGSYLVKSDQYAAEGAYALRSLYYNSQQIVAAGPDYGSNLLQIADRIDNVVSFASVGVWFKGSGDPFAIRQSAQAVIAAILTAGARISLRWLIRQSYHDLISAFGMHRDVYAVERLHSVSGQFREVETRVHGAGVPDESRIEIDAYVNHGFRAKPPTVDGLRGNGWADWAIAHIQQNYVDELSWIAPFSEIAPKVELLLIDRLKVQQREAGVRHDLIDAVFALGGEDDLVRLLARVHALQAFMATEDGANLLAGYKRAANILKKEGYATTVIPAKAGISGDGAGQEPHETPASAGVTQKQLSYTPENEEAALIAALDAAAPTAQAAVAAERFEDAMAALATLRAPIDAFFDKVTVNDSDPAKRAARLALLARMRDAVHAVADFSKIEG